MNKKQLFWNLGFLGLATIIIPPAIVFSIQNNNQSDFDNEFNPEISTPQSDFKWIVNGPNSAIIQGFQNGVNLQNVVIPSTIIDGDVSYKVIEISNYAFSGNNIKNLILPPTIISIGSNAFAFNQIENITFPNSLTNIGSSAFFHNNIKNLEFPNSVKIIENSAFSGNPLEHLNLNEVEFIGKAAFAYNQLQALAIPNFVQKISSQAFIQKTPLLKFLTLGLNVIYIGLSAFANTNLNNVIIPNENTTWVQSSFDNFSQSFLSSFDPQVTIFQNGKTFKWNGKAFVALDGQS